MATERLGTEAARGRTGERLRSWVRRARTAVAFPVVPGEARRPAIFTLLFWIVLLAALAASFFVPDDQWRRFGWPAILIATAALVAAWQALPWDPRVGGRRILLVPAFLVAAVLFGHVTVFLWSLALYPIAVANAVFRFGVRRGVAFAAVGLPLAWLSVYAYDPREVGFWDATFMTALVVPMAVFMVGICRVVLDAERSREAAQALLADLEGANAELRRQAERVKALAIAEERARVAREVHDALGHHLTAINLQLQNAERFAPRDPARAGEKLREARASTLAALAEVRRSVRALKPPALDQRSGVAALSALARTFDGAGPEVCFKLEGEERPLPEEVELALYRATQEGLTNAARHAAATHVLVTLVLAPDRATLTVADDGAGAPEAALDGGFGLAALRERVEALGGTFAAGTRPEGGFALAAVLPLVPPVADRGPA
jgi:signal transduction histidine kinase